MGPGINIALPEWPPARRLELFTRYKELATFVLPEGLDIEREFFPEYPGMAPPDWWRLGFGDKAEGLEFNVTLRWWSNHDPAVATAFGWAPKGEVEFYGFKSGDMSRTVRTLAMIICEAAEILGGLIGLDEPGPESVDAPGQLYDVVFEGDFAGEHDYYADPTRFHWLAQQAGFTISGWGMD